MATRALLRKEKFAVFAVIIAGLFGLAQIYLNWFLIHGPISSPLSLPSPDEGIVMVMVPKGDFLMGTKESDIGGLGGVHAWYASEIPQRTVHLDSFYISKYEITNEQYEVFLRSDAHSTPSVLKDTNFNKPKQPVVGISWNDATAYCSWLSEKTGRRYRLPTEAQWERAARGVDGRIYPWGGDHPAGKANFQNQERRTQPVGTYPEGMNALGVFDMAGNVSEWCLDWYDMDYYKSGERNNPAGSMSGPNKVVRGGSWNDNANGLRCANREDYNPHSKKETIGFRIVRIP